TPSRTRPGWASRSRPDRAVRSASPPQPVTGLSTGCPQVVDQWRDDAGALLSTATVLWKPHAPRPRGARTRSRSRSGRTRSGWAADRSPGQPEPGPRVSDRYDPALIRRGGDMRAWRPRWMPVLV